MFSEKKIVLFSGEKSVCIYFTLLLKKLTPKMPFKIIQAESSEKLPSSMRKMCVFTSCTKSHPSICSPLKHSTVSNDCLLTAKALIRRSGCTGRSRPLLLAYARRHIFAWGGPFSLFFISQISKLYISCESSLKPYFLENKKNTKKKYNFICC